MWDFEAPDRDKKRNILLQGIIDRLDILIFASIGMREWASEVYEKLLAEEKEEKEGKG
jgi:hypothetical protein